uniref:tRNA-yW synthesizing protein 5 n=1 Tax=Falco tinnunculus TaxID=100819 RepID=A0A8C4UM16_FALTI
MAAAGARPVPPRLRSRGKQGRRRSFPHGGAGAEARRPAAAGAPAQRSAEAASWRWGEPPARGRARQGERERCCTSCAFRRAGAPWRPWRRGGRPWRCRWRGWPRRRGSSSCGTSIPGTLPFDVFVRRAAEVKHKEYFLSEDEKYYLRSVGEDARKDIADIRKQFPVLAEDIHIPEYFEKEQFFSSIFRISSAGLQLWTHYDVMDNFLIQVTGKKRVVLYSPRDAPYLYLSGTKSEVLDVDNPDLQKYPLFVKAKRYECVLEAGDVLFIPALWFHSVISEEFGVAVNVFWKHLPAESYDKSDAYGNKDPMAASRALQILDRALKTLEELPEEYRDFYARRMVLRIQEKAYRNDCG